MNGMRTFSSLSPSAARTAGSTVSEPMTATAITRIVARPMLMKIVLPVSSMPAIAAMTVRPEIRTARPEVAAAMSIASSLLCALGALLTLAADVEERVVDADGEADEHDRRQRDVVHRHDLAGRARRGRPCRRSPSGRG